jgi:hypothetical protein
MIEKLIAMLRRRGLDCLQGFLVVLLLLLMGATVADLDGLQGYAVGLPLLMGVVTSGLLVRTLCLGSGVC